MRAALPFGLLVLALAASAQTPRQKPEPTPAQRATRLVRELELPARRAHAASALLELGAIAVPALVQQARHPDLAAAQQALQVLAALGHDGLAAVPDLEAMANGKDAHARAAAWTLARLPHRGTFLVPSMEENLVRELDADGKEIWQSPKVNQPWAAQRLAGGNLLVAEINGAAREYDAEGNVVWEHEGGNIYTAERLIDGNTLIAEYGKRRIVEVDPAGNEVWKVDDVQALYAARLPGGNTLICDYGKGRVIEVDRSGTIVWELTDVPQSYVCQRLSNGQTLVVLQQQKVAKVFDRAGKQLSEQKLANTPSHILPLPDGWITSGHHYVTRLGQDGKPIWKYDSKGWVGRVTLR